MLYNLQQFREHVEGIYSRELYYGDEVLHQLLEHSKEITNDIEDFQGAYNNGGPNSASETKEKTKKKN